MHDPSRRPEPSEPSEPPEPPGPPGPPTVDDVRAMTAGLPRSYEVVVRDRVKFRVGQIVYLAFSADETQLGLAFPKEEREAMIAAQPDTFLWPRPSDLRFNWLEVRLAAIDREELRELVLDAWRMVVPKKVAAGHLGRDVHPRGADPTVG